MIAFVTGGTGFVGGWLCERLRRDGWEVRALARRGSKTDALEAAGCRLVRGAIESEKAIRRAVGQADVVFHLAAVTNAVRPEVFRQVNAEGTRHVLVAAEEGGFRGRFVLLSSLAAAGPAPAGGEYRTEADAPAPVSLYGRSKLLAERYARQARQSFPVTILRPGAIYGPREHELFKVIRPMSRFRVNAVAGPDFLVQMTHVEDVVEALVAAATQPGLENRTYFVNDPQSWRSSQVIAIMGEALGRPVRTMRIPRAAAWGLAGVVDGAGKLLGRPVSPFGRDKMRELVAGDWIADSGRLTRESGWRAKWLFPEGMRQTIEWYRRNGWL
ncbi:NAD-dependent epimerase/dehydratase family protein [Candidatus Poribacteria bacterium]|nr:NAD-dependent epimerase/dehydratase family protein [Candidatus Poribacteria bacterium]